MNRMSRYFAVFTAAVLGFGTLAGAQERKIVIGMVAKSQGNAVFQAAHAGAEAAAKELGSKYNAAISIDWQTPPEEDAQKQAQAIDALAGAGVQGLLVSCSNAETLKSAIDRAARKKIPVMTFDSDAPTSRRFACYGTDDAVCGRVIMEELARSMNDAGVVAILAGNQSAPNLQKRVQAAKDELKNHPNIKLLEASGGVFYHVETPENAVQAVKAAQDANPSVTGWAMIGGWPLFTANALPWAPGKIKVVSCDALPAELEYVKDGHVDALFAQDCYGWGYKGVETLLEKIVNDKQPQNPIIVDPLTKVTRDNVADYGKNWDKWLKP